MQLETKVMGKIAKESWKIYYLNLNKIIQSYKVYKLQTEKRLLTNLVLWSIGVCNKFAELIYHLCLLPAYETDAVPSQSTLCFIQQFLGTLQIGQSKRQTSVPNDNSQTGEQSCSISIKQFKKYILVINISTY